MPLPRPKSISRAIFYAVVTAFLGAAAKLAGTIFYQNVETLSAERGLDRLLSKNWGEIVSWVGENHIWLALTVSFFLGGTVSLCLYVFFVGKEQIKRARSERLEPAQIADDADALCRDIRILVSNYDSRERAAFIEDARGAHDGSRIAEVQSQMFREYLDKYSNQFTDVKYRAERCISFNFDVYYYIMRGVDSGFAVKSLPEALEKLAGDLRYAEPPLAAHSRFLQKQNSKTDTTTK